MKNTCETECKALAVIGSIVIACLISACSFHIGFDYNGKTGVDNRTATEFQRAKVVHDKDRF